MNTIASITIEDLIYDIYSDKDVSNEELLKLYEEKERSELTVLKEEGKDGILAALLHSFDIHHFVMLTLLDKLKNTSASERKEILRVLDSNLLVLQANLDIFHSKLHKPGEVHDFDKVTDNDEMKTLKESKSEHYALLTFYKANEVTEQLLQEVMLRFKNQTYTDTARTLVAAAIQANILFLEANVRAFEGI
ncbi:MAG: hypothetical protein MI922_02315 [Bacteroidales bacterium]|nr:hypothetical protein [Bacteroidales bacterium]